MINNSTIINKTNNHLSLQLTEHKKNTEYDVENSGPSMGQTGKCGGGEKVNYCLSSVNYLMEDNCNYLYMGVIHTVEYYIFFILF